ncbi:trehalose transport-related protein [Naematelia encephala]|uniref:Trehalose transport-related protein n=1 Tax=Naematelia encephala TaxID=71784 RepID=A0A1Y2AE97_9TREE|nr:trehalose transport-related protein [Naematelia encephala]
MEDDLKHAPVDGQVGLTQAQLDSDLDVDIDLLRVGHQVIERQKTEDFAAVWRYHWRAAIWSLIISMALWMEGYDTNVINSFYALPVFEKRFGRETNGVWAVPASTQTGLSNTTTCGQALGLIISGFCQERFGMRKTYIGGMIFLTGTIFIAVFANSLSMLYAAEFMMGVPWGMFQTLTTAYASEICPINMRGYLAAWASMGWGGGKFIAVGVLRAALSYSGDWGWRMPYAVQWIWPAPLILAVILAPESPWWLVRQGRMDQARAVIKKIARPGYYAEGEVDGFAEYMRHTDALERAESAKASWLEMFRGTNLRRTEIQMAVWVIQQWNGNAITNLTTEFLQAAGMSTTFSFDFTIISNSLSILAVGCSWVLLRYVGRRPIYVWGIMSIVILNLLIGILGVVKQTTGTSMGLGVLMTLVNFAFHLHLGPVCYTIVGEIPASRLRAISIAWGRFSYVCSAIIVNFLNPYMISKTAWNWGAKSGFFWVGAGLVCFTWAFFRLPETQGFSFAELDILFANKVSARKFKQVDIKGQSMFLDTRLPRNADVA